jgi:hypothetical protein
MDNLFCGNLFPPPSSEGQIGRRLVQRRFVKTASETDSGQRDRHSGSQPLSDRHQPGTAIGIIPES